jgi:hypothetical protein
VKEFFFKSTVECEKGLSKLVMEIKWQLDLNTYIRSIGISQHEPEIINTQQ